MIRNKFSGFVNGVRLFNKGGSTTQQTQNIPTELKPLANAYSQKAIDLSNQEYSPYGGTRYADLNQYQTYGADAMYNRASGGSGTINAGNQMLQDTLSGKYLNSNPYLDESFNAQKGAVTDAYNDAMNNSDTMAARSGAFGGSAWNQMQQDNSDVLAKNLGNLSSNVYAQNYANERANQLNSAGLGLQYGNQDYTDAANAIKAGQLYQDQSQQGLDFNYEQYQEMMNDPYKKLSAMGGVFGSYPSSTSSKTSGGGK